jgi:O-antigen/teichoic acid export membrane protein
METGGYLLAYIIANFIVAIYAIIAGKGYKAFSFHNIDRCKLKEMIRYSVVLIPNTFMWWIMNSSDRVMVTYMIGAAANGIYAVSYKLPTLVSTLTGIFNQAWSYSAIREEGTSDETEYNNKMFKTLSAIAFMMGIGLLLLTKPFLGVYVADSYYDAWKYTPFLIIGCVYLTLGTFMATSYTVHKDSFGYLFSGSFNILLNFILIPVIGVYGAALATCISYIAVFMFRVFHTRKYIKYDIMYKEFILGSLLMLVSAILMFVDGMKGFLLQLVILLIGFTVFSKTWIPMLQFKGSG